MSAELMVQTGCKHTEESEAAIMEYIHGDKGYAILIRQNLIPDKNEDHFCGMFWQEFIAEAISQYVSYKNRSAGDSYHPELIDWKRCTGTEACGSM